MDTRVRCSVITPLLIALADPVLASVDFQQCFADIRQGLYGTTGGTDSHGNPVAIANATSITYELCLRACGTGSTPFSWPTFNQQFSAWLLPWLALLSQFPFGSRYKWDNFMSALLALGSPCLAAYSLILTVLHTKWLARRFANIKYPNSGYAARILNSLQQTPIMVRTDGGRLASLIVLPENDPWWMELVERLDYADTHTWSIAAAASVAWVVIAYALTIVDAFSRIPTDSENNLSGAGSIWVWMLPVTIAYLQISPRDPDRTTAALTRANDISFVAGPNGVVRATTCALSFHPYRGSLFADQENTTPIYAYARFFPFIQLVEEFASAFHYATEKSSHLQAVDPDINWVPGNGNSIDPANRTGTAEQIEAYCATPAYVRRSQWGPEALSRFCIASLAALALQWATTGASILLAYVTPAVGLGCASLTYLLYGTLATLIWALLVLSSVTEHYATTHSGVPDVSHRVAAWSSVLLRRVSKLLAIFNALWIVSTFLFRFSNFYHRCYCNSDVLGLSKTAYFVLVFDGSEISTMKAAWIGGVALAVMVSSLFLGFINLPINPPFSSE